MINKHLAEKGLTLRNGTIVDATLIAAAPSTKNKAKQRDPDMHQSKKGNQYYFGMKAHIGVDVESGLVHSLVGTSGNVSDISKATEVLHGDEKVVFADAGYTGIEKREEAKALDIHWQIAEKRGKLKKLGEDSAYRKALEALESAKASIRSKVEHPFHVIKNIFRHRKARYRGLSKNTAQLFSLFGLGNLMLAKKYLLPEYGKGTF